MAAVVTIDWHFRIDARHNLEHGAHGINDLALRSGAAARQINHLGVGEFGTVGAGSFQATHAFDHQRGDRQQGDNDEPGADAEDSLLRRGFAADVVDRVFGNVLVDLA
jgi:hypothetical protein